MRENLPCSSPLKSLPFLDSDDSELEKNLDCFADERVKTTFALNCHLLWLFIFQKSYSTGDDDRDSIFFARKMKL